MNSSPKIVFIGAYKSLTPAEEAMFLAALKKIKQKFPRSTLIALSEEPIHTRKIINIETVHSIEHYLLGSSVSQYARKRKFLFFKIRCVRRFFISLRALWLLINAKLFSVIQKTILINNKGKNIIKNLYNTDLVFHTGGGDINGFTEPFFYGIIYLIANIFKKPIIVSAQTIGPFNNFMQKKIVSYFLNRVNVLISRDDVSFRCLESLKVKNPIVKNGIDDAFFIAPANDKTISNILKQEKIEIDTSLPLIALNIQSYPPFHKKIFIGEQSKKLVPILAKIADYFISKYNARIIFIPMKQRKFGNDNDKLAISKIRSLMQHKDKSYIINNIYDGSVLKGILSKAQLAIGTRYHFVVFGTSMVVPTIALSFNEYYARKFQGVLGRLGRNKYIIDTKKINYKKIRELACKTLFTSQKEKKILSKKIQNLKKRNLISVKYINKFIK